jgi:hypothetical protein
MKLFDGEREKMKKQIKVLEFEKKKLNSRMITRRNDLKLLSKEEKDIIEDLFSKIDNLKQETTTIK